MPHPCHVPVSLRRLGGAVALALLLAAPAAAQPATTRTPNLEGAWTTPGGTAFFAFLHRFQLIAPAGNKLVNYPTFHLSGGLADWISVGLLYASQTEANPAGLNETELFSAQRLLREEEGAPLSISLHEGYNIYVKSIDGAVNLTRSFGPITFLGTARVMGNYQLTGTQRVSTGLGASWGLTPQLRLAADAAYAVYRPTTVDPAEPPVVWGAGLQVAIPNSPHTLSLQVSNAASTTIHGQSTASTALRYGFDFTIPFVSLQPWVDMFRIGAKPEPVATPAPPAGSDAPEALPKPAATERPLVAAKAFFQARCIGCHGAGGTGGFGPDLRKVEAKGDAFITERIAKGSPKGMPPFEQQLTSAELGDLVAYVKRL